VIGADRLHSGIRQLVFGPQDKFEKYLGYKVAEFEIESYRPRDELVYVMYIEVHQQVARFTIHGDRTMILFTFADEQADIGDAPAPKALLRKRYYRGLHPCRLVASVERRSRPGARTIPAAVRPICSRQAESALRFAGALFIRNHS